LSVRLAFLGTPDAAVPVLRALVGGGHDVVVVVTRADKRRGRGGEVAPSPVKQAAVELAIPVVHRVDEALDRGAELGVVVAFGQLIKPDALARLQMVNLHFSLLPRWRGAAPVERAVLAGDSETGVCVMAVEEGLDTGGIYAVTRLAIAPTETAANLRQRLVTAGVDLLLDVLARPGGIGEPAPQVGEPSYAAKITPADLELLWSRPAVELARLPRVGRAWTIFRGRRLLVLEARAVVASLRPGVLDGVVVGTVDGGLELVTVQPEGKAPVDAAAWRNGARPSIGERLGVGDG